MSYIVSHLISGCFVLAKLTLKKQQFNKIGHILTFCILGYRPRPIILQCNLYFLSSVLGLIFVQWQFWGGGSNRVEACDNVKRPKNNKR